jgi:hypothetical protein
VQTTTPQRTRIGAQWYVARFGVQGGRQRLDAPILSGSALAAYTPAMSDDFTRETDDTDEMDDAGDVDLDEPGDDGSVEPADDDPFDVEPSDDERDGDLG